MTVKPAGPQARKPSGHLIAFEGLDQSGKQTQAERLLAAFRAKGHATEFLTFPAYETAIGDEIGKALHGERDYQPDTLQLLYIANRFEFKPADRVVARGRARWWCAIATSRRASPMAKRRASMRAWLTEIQRFLPQPSLTILLDIPPDASLNRKQVARDKFERDLPLLGRVRESYLRQAGRSNDWFASKATRTRTRCRPR